MAEVLEYAFVLLASSLLLFFSAATYRSFSGTVSSAEFHASFASVVGTAANAVETGSSSLTLVLGRSTLSCHDGQLALASGSLSSTYQLPVTCDFSVSPPSGSVTLSFTYDGSLSLRVS